MYEHGKKQRTEIRFYLSDDLATMKQQHAKTMEAAASMNLHIDEVVEKVNVKNSIFVISFQNF